MNNPHLHATDRDFSRLARAVAPALLAVAIAGCAGRPVLERLLLGYDEVTSRLDQKLLLNIARTDNGKPVPLHLDLDHRRNLQLVDHARYRRRVAPNVGRQLPGPQRRHRRLREPDLQYSSALRTGVHRARSNAVQGPAIRVSGLPGGCD
ncbi:hypothetical protein [Candidatus Accumulibacter sp. ACC003]|uniref:hypothetical protein n=1 Tax=Candidatus Accumulibacter sp. ACC003 TaxID=2823334 RepID=UPI0025C484D0|nr:hypothetical protein [Candidatus Accumulibacter sp. ACC003]